MKTYNYISSIILTLGLVSCSAEAPFGTENSIGEGHLDTSSLLLNLNVDETIKVRSRAGNDDLLPDFKVYFLDSKGQSVKDYKYGEMPEIVTLPEGNYTVKAIYGEDLAASWDNPYFTGDSEEFSIKANNITTDLNPVECSLKNVMVSIVFDSELMEHITGEPKVEVYVNSDSSLVYSKTHSDNKTPGYFGHYEVCTLMAEFSGNVDGVDLKEIKTLTNVEPGNHYRLTFYKHTYTGDESGNAETDVQIDAKVTVNNVSADVNLGEDSILTDVTWPTEDGDKNEEPGEDENPNTPEDPNVPDNPTSEGPTVEMDPASTVEIGKVNDVTPYDVVIMKIHSNTGITKFIVDIISDSLHLSDVGADSDSIDLINPGKMTETWQEIGILKPGETTLEGKTDVDFDITGLMKMLCALNGEHKFVINVADDEGETSVTLILNVP